MKYKQNEGTKTYKQLDTRKHIRTTKMSNFLGILMVNVFYIMHKDQNQNNY